MTRNKGVLNYKILTYKEQYYYRMEASNKLKVITFKGPAYEVEYIPIMTTGDLKAHILQIDHSVPDFDFIYAGRMIRANDKVLEDFVRADNMTIYTNAKGVHGGCGYGCG